jgi:antitoxin component of MazEF toxin-antitoxin module
MELMMTAIPISKYLAELPVSRPSGESTGQRITRLARLADFRTEPDPAAEIEKAYRRGLEEGRAAARAEYAKHIDDLRQTMEAERIADRVAWTQAEAARFADALEASMSSVEGRIAEVVARVLEPFLVEAQRQRAVQHLVDAINQLTVRQQGLSLAVTGPEDLLVAINERLGSRVQVELRVSDTVDVLVETADSTIETRIASWMQSVAEALRV